MKKETYRFNHDKKKTEAVRGWVVPNKPAPTEFWDILPRLRHGFETPITYGPNLRDEILGDTNLTGSIRSLVCATAAKEWEDAQGYLEDVYENLYVFLDQPKVKYRLGPAPVVIAVVDMIFGLVFSLSTSESVSLYYYNWFLERIYEDPDFQSETGWTHVRSHQRDMVDYLIDGYETHQQIQEEYRRESKK